LAELVSIKRNVDVSPGQAAPAVFHCSQGDVGSKIILGLLNNGTAYSIPSGVTVTIEGSESNGSIFTPISATASGSDITFYLTGEMTAVAGPAICQAVLKSGSNILGTANFTLEVESSPMGADAPPVFTDAGWTWMLNKLNTEFVPALGNETIIDAIDGKLDKNQGTANTGKYLKVGTDGNVTTAELDVTTDKTLSIADKAADAKAVGDELNDLKADLMSMTDDILSGVSITNGYISNAGGWTSTQTSYAEVGTQEFIEVSSDLVVALDFAFTSRPWVAYCFYDKNKASIGERVALSDMKVHQIIEIPKTAKYFRISWASYGVTKNSAYALVTFDGINQIALNAASEKVRLLTNYTSLDTIAYSANGNPIEIRTDDSNNIIVTIPNRIYVMYFSANGIFIYDTIDSSGNYTVPNDYYLIADSSTKTISVKSFSEIRNLSETSRFNVLCLNYRGTALGMLSQYVNTRLPYYDAYIANITNAINMNKAVYGINGLSFYFITDEHWKQNAQKSVYLINELRRNTGIDLVINGGDILTKETTKQLAYKVMSNFLDDLESTGCDVYSCIGNHEYNNPNKSQAEADLAITLSLEEVCSVLYDRQIYNNATFDSVSGCFYIDIKKTRIFILQCNYGSNVYLTATRWVMEQMQEIPEGYNVILFSHVITEWNADMSTTTPKDRVQAVINAMDAIKTGTSVTYENRTYDYSSLVNVTPIAVFGGHAHVDYDFYTPGGIPVILATCDSDIQESGGLTRTRGTTSEQAFDVVTINFTAKNIKLTRVGAGEDREFTY